MSALAKTASRVVGLGFAVVAGVVVGGCATLGGTTLEPTPLAHYVMVHKEGDPYTRERQKIDPTTFEGAYLSRIFDGVSAHVERARDRKEPGRVLIFVHGGLNPYQGSLHRVRTLLDVTAEDRAGCHDPTADAGEDTVKARDDRHQKEDLVGVLHCTSYYPIFINWNSSLFSSLWDDFFIIRNGERRPFLAALTAPFILAGRLIDSGFSVPASLTLLARRDFPPPEPEDEPAPDRGLTYYALAPVRAVTVPFIQGFGTGAWEVMKRRADFVTATALPEEALKELGESHPIRRGAGVTFMTALADRLCLDTAAGLNWRRGVVKAGEGRRQGEIAACGQGDGAHPVEITLAGHSMGALVLNRILRRFPYVPFQRIVYLAAASSLTDFEDSVLSFLDRNQGSQFTSFSLSLHRERYEKGPGDFYERGSLLVWIDYLFERVNTLHQLRSGRFRNLYQPSREYVQYVTSQPGYRGRVSFVKLTGPHAPDKHGDFGNHVKLPCLLGLLDPRAVQKTGCEEVVTPRQEARDGQLVQVPGARGGAVAVKPVE